jgi:hypothetical protein
VATDGALCPCDRRGQTGTVEQADEVRAGAVAGQQLRLFGLLHEQDQPRVDVGLGLRPVLEHLVGDRQERGDLVEDLVDLAEGDAPTRASALPSATAAAALVTAVSTRYRISAESVVPAGNRSAMVSWRNLMSTMPGRTAALKRSARSRGRVPAVPSVRVVLISTSPEDQLPLEAVRRAGPCSRRS